MGVRRYAALWVLMAAILAVHLTLFLMLSDPGLRRTALWMTGTLAFYIDVFRSGDFLYSGQRFVTLVTYGFVHVGWLHLAVNLAMLAPLGVLAIRRVGQGRFLALYTTTLILAAIVYGLTTSAEGRMMGASGAIHGLAGALAVWAWRDGAPRRTAAILLAIALANLWFWWLTSGHFAWQLHLAGLAAGAALAPVMSRGTAPA